MHRQLKTVESRGVQVQPLTAAKSWVFNPKSHQPVSRLKASTQPSDCDTCSIAPQAPSLWLESFYLLLLYEVILFRKAKFVST